MKKLLALLLLFAPLAAQDIPLRGNLVPNTNDALDLGKYNRRFDTLYVHIVVGDTIYTETLLVPSVLVSNAQGLSFFGNTFLFRANSTDGSDNQRFVVAGGGTSASSRGAYLILYGNEYASSDSGRAYYATGATTTTGHYFQSARSSSLANRFIIDDNSGTPRVTVGATAGTGNGNFYGGDTMHVDNRVNVGGLSVATTVDTVIRTFETTSISAENFAGTASATLYRANIYLNTLTTGSAGTVTATLNWTDDGAADSLVTSAVTLSAAGQTSTSFVFYSHTGTPTWKTTVAGASGSPTYSIRIALEGLW
jgi:hypothetical protein